MWNPDKTSVATLQSGQLSENLRGSILCVRMWLDTLSVKDSQDVEERIWRNKERRERISRGAITMSYMIALP